MKILVTVSEVTTVDDDFEIDGVRIDDRYVDTDLNEWDEYAIEAAVQLQETDIADEVVTVTIGPSSCEQTIRQALAKGADRAIRIWDDSLEDADLLDVGVKSTVLQAVAEAEDPDLILTGVQSGDVSFGATGVSLAAALDMGWAAVVNHLEIREDQDSVFVHRELEGGLIEQTTVELPAVLTIQTGINEPRYASLRGIRMAQQKEITHVTVDDLDLDASTVSSDLRLTELQVPVVESDVTTLEGDSTETASELATILREKGVGQ